MKRLVVASLAILSILPVLSAVFGFQTVPAQAAETTASYGAGANPTGDPIGGGTGYSNIITSGNFEVDSKAELLSALSTVKSGQVIYLPGDAEIDLSGQTNISIPEGVTIASNRGQSGSFGGLLYWNGTTEMWKQVFRPRSHVTFNGIRLRGPDGNVGTSDQPPMVTGIWCAGYHGLIVENCEIFNWTFAGVTVYTDGLGGNLESPDRGYVHHNSFHHNRRLGEGYGVSVGAACALIQANLFDYGRHFIEGERGTQTCNYIAEYNVFGPNCTHTLVDCHGGNDIPDASIPAGGTLIIRYNTFQNASQPSVKPRGVPAVKCEVYRNWTYHSSQSSAFKQEIDDLGLTPYVNMSVHDNWYGTTSPPTTNYAPVLDAIGNKTVVEEDMLTFTISGSDADGDTLTYSASNLPLGASFDSATRTFSWTPGSSQSGAYTNVHFQVSDGKLTDSEDITITVAVNNPLQADINSDGAVNSLDMIRIGQHWGETGIGGWIREDINQDGIVSVLDATLVGQHWTG